MSKAKIEARTLQGFSDYLPDTMLVRQYAKHTLEKVFQSFGYGQIETPCLEYQDILTGKYGEDEKLIYKFEDNGERKVALRYDLTVPLARVIGQHQNDISFPFKRYHIEKVWRADSPRKGRKREFYQCDVDIVGAESVEADAEILLIAHAGFQALGLTEHVILLNNRKILNSFMRKLEIAEDQVVEVLRSIDKYDKVGLEGVEKELNERKIKSTAIPQILEFIDKKNESNQKTLEKLKTLLTEEEGQEGLAEVEKVLNILKSYDVPDQNIDFNLRLTRGLDYYTGMVFEVVLPEFGQMSLAGGGRYDDLCGIFAGKDITATGLAFGFEPICAALAELGLGPKQKNVDILVTVFAPELLQESLLAAKTLREAGLKVSLYPDSNTKLGKQFKYADQNNIPFALVIGDDEKQKGEVVLKNMSSGEQESIKIEDITSKIVK